VKRDSQAGWVTRSRRYLPDLRPGLQPLRLDLSAEAVVDLGEDRAGRVEGDQYDGLAGRQCRYGGQYQRVPLAVRDFAHVKAGIHAEHRRRHRAGIEAGFAVAAAGAATTTAPTRAPAGRAVVGAVGAEQLAHAREDVRQGHAWRGE
jgi:hypothetical protein